VLIWNGLRSVSAEPSRTIAAVQRKLESNLYDQCAWRIRHRNQAVVGNRDVCVPGCTAFLDIAKLKTRTVGPTKLTVRTSAKAKSKTGRIHNEKTSVVLRPVRVFCADLRIGKLLPTVMALDPSPIIGNWEGTLDPGAQPKKRIVVHIAAAQDGSLSGTIRLTLTRALRGR